MSISPAASPLSTPHGVVIEAPKDEERVSPLSLGSWALYDFANTIFSLNIVSTFFPLFVKERGLNDAAYAYPMSGALLIVALFMPLLGSLSDRAGKRMPWLISFSLFCIAMTFAMGLVGDVWLVIVLFIAANIAYQVALLFYDALLPSVSTTLNWGKVSGLGVGLGYVGALFGSLAVGALVGDSAEQEAFIPTALLFLVFAIPCFIFVRERRATVTRAMPGTARASWRGGATQTWRTLMETRAVPGLFLFLIANFFYSDALNTVIVAMQVFAREVFGFTNPTTVLAPAIIAAVLGSWLFGFLSDRLTAKTSLVISLTLWLVVLAAMIFVRDAGIFQWVLAPLAGIALGSTWTAARTMMVELSPPAKLGEYMGIYNLTGKFSAVIGPALWGTMLLVLDPRVHGYFAYQVAITGLFAMVLIGLILHLRTPNIKREKSG